MSNQTYQRHRGAVFGLITTCALTVSACGSGGTTPTSNSADSNIVAEPSQLSGTIVVEERNGKTVFDGWFVQGSAEDVIPSVGAGLSSDDVCEASSVNVESVLASASNQNSNSWKELKSIDGSADVQSRAGAFESLVKQQAGSTTVYAPEDRWQSDSLPDDAVLAVESESNLGQIDGVDVPPLMPLVWLQPESGVMSSAGSPLQWEASLNDEVRINLKLSAIDFRDSQNPTVTSIDCNLIDDGQFTLPENLLQELPDDHSGIVVYAVRERIQKIQNSHSSLTVVQLSYPAPVKP